MPLPVDCELKRLKGLNMSLPYASRSMPIPLSLKESKIQLPEYEVFILIIQLNEEKL
jgi:hypothetical protein